MAIEIDRLINSGELLSDRILNYFLYSQTSPFIPTSINLLPNHEQLVSSTLIIYALITFIFINEIDSRKKLKYFFWVLIFHYSFSVLGIAFKGSSNMNEFVAASTEIWSAPDSRISFLVFLTKTIGQHTLFK